MPFDNLPLPVPPPRFGGQDSAGSRIAALAASITDDDRARCMAIGEAWARRSFCAAWLAVIERRQGEPT